MSFFVNMIIVLAFAPIGAFLHELGHALPILMLSDNDVEIVIGKVNVDKKIYSQQFNRMRLTLGSYAPFVGFCKSSKRFSRNVRLLALICGPVSSLLMFLVIVILTRYSDNITVNNVLNVLANFFLIQFLITAIPMRYNFSAYKGMDSDGMQVLKLLKENNR